MPNGRRLRRAPLLQVAPRPDSALNETVGRTPSTTGPVAYLPELER